MGIDAKISAFLRAEVHRCLYDPTAAIGGNAMDRTIGLTTVPPAFNISIGRVFANPKVKHSMDFISPANNEQVFLTNIPLQLLPGRIGAAPLIGISPSCHKRSGIGIDLQDPGKILSLCWA